MGGPKTAKNVGHHLCTFPILNSESRLLRKKVEYESDALPRMRNDSILVQNSIKSNTYNLILLVKVKPG